jgi:hypothetical protein
MRIVRAGFGVGKDTGYARNSEAGLFITVVVIGKVRI